MNNYQINIGNIKIQIKEYKQDGDPVIFLHFGGGNLMMWERVIPHFQNNFHLILFDLRGHGKSDKPRTGYHIDEMAQDVMMVMNNLKLERAHIIGSSLGAEVGLSLAVNFPDRIHSLVCEGALYSEYGPYSLWEGSEIEYKEHVNQTLDKIRNTSQKIYPSIDALVDESRQMFEPNGWWNEVFESVKRYDANKIKEGEYTDSWGNMAEDYTKHYLNYKFEDYYRQVQCPLLMISDEFPGPDNKGKSIMKRLLNLTNNGIHVSIPEWVHPFGWMLTPDQVSKVTLGFLSEINN